MPVSTPYGPRVPSRSGLWLTKRLNRGGTYRWYFDPSRFDKDNGWKTLRLHDYRELPIADEAEATIACRKIATIYRSWKQGRAGFGRISSMSLDA